MTARMVMLANEFATTLEGHYTTHQVGWLDYVLIGVSSVSVLVALWYTFKFLLPSGSRNEPDIKYLILDREAENDG